VYLRWDPSWLVPQTLPPHPLKYIHLIYAQWFKMPFVNPGLKLDFTCSGGVDDRLFGLIVGYCDQFDTCLLCKEGDGEKVHYHCHAVIHTTRRADSVKRSLKKLYEDNNYIWDNRRTVVVKTITAMAGALSYVYKEKVVLLCKSIILDQIRPWKLSNLPKKTKVVLLTKGNAVDNIIRYSDSCGIECKDYETFKNVIKEMALAKYRVCMILRNIRPIMIDVLAHYGDVSHLDAFLDEACNYPR